jgi:hypothetical protein
VDSRSGVAVRPRPGASSTTIKGSVAAPVSRSRVAPVRLAVTSSAAWMNAKRISMTNSGSTVTSATTASTSPPEKTVSPASAAQASMNAAPIRPTPRPTIASCTGSTRLVAWTTTPRVAHPAAASR